MTRRRIALALALAAGLALLGGASCKFLGNAITVNDKPIGVLFEDPKEDLTPENEYYLGRSVATSILAKHEYKYLGAEAIGAGRLEGPTGYVSLVGALVAAYAPEHREKKDGRRPRPLAGWHFVIVDSDTVNAMASPGGYVFVSRGALALARSEDELACVLAHEVAHVALGHALGNIQKSRYAGFTKDMFKVQADGPGLEKLEGLMEGAIDDTVNAYFVKGYSKETEYEADKLGLSICAQAGYDPSAMVAFLARLAKAQDTGSGGFYQTHPKASERVGKLKKQLAKMAKPAKPPAIRKERYLAAIKEL